MQTAVVKAINELLANKEPFLSTLQKNIATVFNEENDNIKIIIQMHSFRIKKWKGCISVWTNLKISDIIYYYSI